MFHFSKTGLLIDEVFVKPQLTYQGGYVFGKAVNSPKELAKTVLGLMICYLFGGKQLLYKALPVTSLDVNFQSRSSNINNGNNKKLWWFCRCYSIQQ